MSEHNLEASIWNTGRENWSSHGWIHALGSDRHSRWKPIGGQECPELTDVPTWLKRGLTTKRPTVQCPTCEY